MARWRYTLLFIVLFGIGAWSIQARELLQGSDCLVEATQTIEGTLLVLCEQLTIDGTVNGNVIGLALRATQTGTVNGNVYLAGGEFSLSGRISGTLHYAGVAFTAHPTTTISGSVISGTLISTLASGSTIQGNIVAVGYEFNVLGNVAQEVSFWGAGLHLGGEISASVYASVGDPNTDASQIRALLLPFGFDVTLQNPGLRVLETAMIRGEVLYNGVMEGVFSGRVDGTITFTRINAPIPTLDSPPTLTIYWEQVFREFTALASIGALTWAFLPNLLLRPMNQLRLRPVPSFSVGLLSFLLSFPVVMMALLLSFILVLILVIMRLDGVAIALALLLIVANGAGVGGFYFVAIYVARAMIGLALGRFVLSWWRNELSPRHFSLFSLGIGTLLLAFGIALPVIGWIVNALALFAGLGAVVTVGLGMIPQFRETPRALIPVQAPLPPVPVTPRLGMDNLPKGFDVRFFEE